jgi:hypothetical protein
MKMTAFQDVDRVIWKKITVVLEILAASIIREMMVDAARASETSATYQNTQCNNPQDSHLHSRCQDNLKSQPAVAVCFSQLCCCHQEVRK